MELGFTYTSMWQELRQAEAEHESWSATKLKSDDKWRRKVQRSAETWNAWVEYKTLGEPEEPNPPAPVWEPAYPLQ